MMQEVSCTSLEHISPQLCDTCLRYRQIRGWKYFDDVACCGVAQAHPEYAQHYAQHYMSHVQAHEHYEQQDPNQMYQEQMQMQQQQQQMGQQNQVPSLPENLQPPPPAQQEHHHEQQPQGQQNQPSTASMNMIMDV